MTAFFRINDHRRPIIAIRCTKCFCAETRPDQQTTSPPLCSLAGCAMISSLRRVRQSRPALRLPRGRGAPFAGRRPFAGLCRLKRCRRAWKGGGQMQAAGGNEAGMDTESHRHHAGVTPLNPHVYVDAVMLIGGSAAKLAGAAEKMRVDRRRRCSLGAVVCPDRLRHAPAAAAVSAPAGVELLDGGIALMNCFIWLQACSGRLSKYCWYKVCFGITDPFILSDGLILNIKAV